MKFMKQNINGNRPCKPYVPLSKANSNRIRLAIMQERLKFAQLEKGLTGMKNEIKVSGASVSGKISNDMLNIFNQNENKATPLLKLFWEQQKNAFKCNPKLVRYHSMIIRFCISFDEKSTSRYDKLRDSNIVVLPSRRTLRD